GVDDPLLDDSAGLFNEADLVPAPDVELDVGPQQPVLAFDHRGALDDADIGHLGERDLDRLFRRGPLRQGRRAAHAPRPAAWGGRTARRHALSRDEDSLQRLDVVAERPGVADADRVAFPALDRHREGPPAHRDLDHVLDVADLDAVAGRLL